MKGRKAKIDNVVPMRGDTVRPAPPAPDFMSSEARRIWDDLAPFLIAKGRLEPHYEIQFATYCESAANFINATHCLAVEKGGQMYYEVETRNGLQQKKVAVWSIQQEAMGAMLRIGAHFGLSPVDEARLASGDQGDLFDEFQKAVRGE